MKKLVVSLLSLLLICSTQSATAAPKPIVVKEMVAINLAAPVTVDTKMLVIGSSIILLNDSGVRAIGADGVEKWRLVLTQVAASIATALAADSAGNIWIAGSSAIASVVTPTPTPTVAPINPDNVVVDPKVPLRSDLKVATIWKISNTGALISTYTAEPLTALLINSIAINAKGITLGGVRATDTGNSGVIINADLEGKFSKPIFLGLSDTSIDVVVLGTDSSVYAIGNSTETLAGKKVAGYRDGIIAKYSSAGKLSALVRSSAAKARREWLSATNSLFLTGSVQTGQKFESALTKFATNLSPTWTYRFASTGATYSALGPSGSHFAAFASTSAIKGITNWKPIKPTALLLTFDSKGALVDAKSAAGTPLALGYSKDLGIVLMSTGQTAVSIFRLT
ncbi:MAG: hypothetical protein NTZ66_05815 [Actinobacteria bacterium]|nr:hypothetical protein [Actinomycetota bacterium]